MKDQAKANPKGYLQYIYIFMPCQIFGTHQHHNIVQRFQHISSWKEQYSTPPRKTMSAGWWCCSGGIYNDIQDIQIWRAQCCQTHALPRRLRNGPLPLPSWMSWKSKARRTHLKWLGSGRTQVQRLWSQNWWGKVFQHRCQWNTRSWDFDFLACFKTNQKTVQNKQNKQNNANVQKHNHMFCQCACEFSDGKYFNKTYTLIGMKLPPPCIPSPSPPLMSSHLPEGKKVALDSRLLTYPRHPNTCWEGICSMKTYLKHLLGRCLNV